jgi:hypothetical protein
MGIGRWFARRESHVSIHVWNILDRYMHMMEMMVIGFFLWNCVSHLNFPILAPDGFPAQTFTDRSVPKAWISCVS